MTEPGLPLTDLHNHLIPGVDDGSRSVEQSLEGIGRMVEAGVRTIVATPHLDASLTLDRIGFAQRLAEVDDAWGKLSAAVGTAFPSVTLERAFEIALDVPEPKLDDDRLRIAGGQSVLMEWPGMQVPPATPAVLSRFRDQGVRPIIAHPERYYGTDHRVASGYEWKSAGGCLQVNYGSFLGRYGARVRANAFGLLRAGLVDVLATDFHGRPHLELHISEARERFEALGALEHFELLASVNPERLVGDLEPLVVPELPAQAGFWGRVRELFQMRSP